MEDINSFVSLVARMRKAQKEYPKIKLAGALVEKSNLEYEVDRYIANYLVIKDTQDNNEDHVYDPGRDC